MSKDNAQYDKAYCDDDKLFKKPGCKHDMTAVRDARFDARVMTSIREVCCICGRLAKWSRVRSNGEYIVKF